MNIKQENTEQNFDKNIKEPKRFFVITTKELIFIKKLIDTFPHIIVNTREFKIRNLTELTLLLEVPKTIFNYPESDDLKKEIYIKERFHAIITNAKKDYTLEDRLRKRKEKKRIKKNLKNQNS